MSAAYECLINDNDMIEKKKVALDGEDSCKTD